MSELQQLNSILTLALESGFSLEMDIQSKYKLVGKIHNKILGFKERYPLAPLFDTTAADSNSLMSFSNLPDPISQKLQPLPLNDNAEKLTPPLPHNIPPLQPSIPYFTAAKDDIPISPPPYLAEFIKNTVNSLLDEKEKIKNRIFTPYCKATLQDMVDLWIADKHEAIILFGEINTWNTEYITDMSDLFRKKCGEFNDDISKWNTSRVVNMDKMFTGCGNFNQPLPWDTSRVLSMNNMFEGCKNFNQPLPWDTSRVRSMSFTFSGCLRFNQMLHWNTSQVTVMSFMFSDCIILNQPLQFDMTNVKKSSGILNGCSAFKYKFSLRNRYITGTH